jgi:Ca-activated chloride channel family protein
MSSRSRSPVCRLLGLPLSLLVTATFVAPACGTGAASSGVGTGAPLQAATVDAAPGHRFTPRAHPPRRRPAVPAPDLASLPALTDRTSQCFGFSDDEVAIARSAPPPSTGSTRSKSKGAKSRKSASRPSKSGFVPFDPGGSSGGVGSSSASATVPSSPKAEPAKRPSPKPSADKKSKDAPAAEKREEDAGGSPRDVAPAEVGLGGEALALDDATRAPGGDGYDDWGAAIYLSNDDTMSLSSAQRVIFAIDKFLPLTLDNIRPHELLNYFSFETAPVAAQDDFSVLADIAPDPKQEGIYNLALAVKGRPLDLQARRNANLTFVIDRSGSMSDGGRMDYLKRGMNKMTSQLKTGDIVNVVLFDHEECTPLENFVVGRDKPEILQKAIDKMKPRGSTDVHLGLTKGYELADKSYQPTYNNRVVIITDALANTGNTDPRTMAMVGKYYDSRKIRLSGVGVGTEFNDALLDKLTEKGKGAYVFLGSEAETDAVFGPRFISLLETTAMDVHFQLHLPPSLRMNVFYGEESSTVKEDVQSIHYFANTSQLFLSELMAKNQRLRPQDSVMLTIEYEDPETGDAMLEEFAFNLGEATEQSKNVQKARTLMHFIDGLAVMASRPLPSSWAPQRAAWIDEGAFDQCQQGREGLHRLAAGIADDPEVRRVAGLWDRYCSRFEQPRRPVKRAVPTSTSWPSATGG